MSDAKFERKFDDNNDESAGELPPSTDLFQAIGHPTIILDVDHTILAANGATARALGIPAVEIVGRKCFDVFHGKEGESSIPECCPMEKMMASGEFETEQVEVESLDRTYLVSCTPVFDENGDIDRVIHIATDITETKKAEQQKVELQEQLLRSKKMEAIGRLAGSIAHDFNNLLLPILAYSEMLTKDLTQRDPRQRGLIQIKEAAERARNLTQKLLAFSRHQVLEIKTLNLNRMVTNFSAVFKESVNSNIEFVIRLAPKRLTFMGDVTQLERVIMNLVVNAQDAMPEGGTLTIETDMVSIDSDIAPEHPELKPGSYVVLSVRDTGCGIEKETLQDIFDPFFTTKEASKGTGLGLSTVFGIANQHSGKVGVDSELGQGSVFKVYLPKQDGITSSLDGLVEKKEIIGGHETLLLVEDDHSVRKTIEHLLANLGYNILVARDGLSGLGIVKDYKEPISLLLTDLVMPNMNGSELYQKIHELRPEIEVLFMSGFTDETIDEHGLTLEHEDFLSKPFTIGVLATKIRDKLDAD